MRTKNRSPVRQRMDEKLSIHLLGGFKIHYCNSLILQINTSRLQALIAYLALLLNEPVPRQQLSFSFWSDSAEDQARANLRVLIHSLHRSFSPIDQFWFINSQQITRVPDSLIWVDCIEFKSLANSSDPKAWQKAVDLYAGDLFPDCYEEWIVPYRQEYRNLYESTLKKLTAHLKENNFFKEAISLSERMLSADPINETLYADVMEMQAQIGNISGITHTYNACKAALFSELDLLPSPVTEICYQKAIETARSRPTQTNLSLPDQQKHRLPIRPTRFIGREKELTELSHLLEKDIRLLTLTGPGGIGKSRLALALVTKISSTFDDIWWLDLTVINHPEDIYLTIAAELNIKNGQNDFKKNLSALLHDRKVLVIFDNCEHLREEIGRCIAIFMEADANATILATSRIRLSIANEEVWQVPSLDYRVANGTDHASAEINPFHEKKCDSVLLFLDRALEATPDFRTSLDELREINSICQYLEGIPLAIEIAASASRLLTIPQIAARMSKIDQLPVPDHLRVSHKQVPLRSIVDWSINLIGEPGSILLARLSIFAGPFTLSAAEEICHDDRLKKEEVLACIGLLLDHSLLSVDRSQKNPQFSMHEVIRQAAFVLLKASDDVASYQSKHISYYTSLAEQIEPLLQGPDQGEWLEKLDREFSNIRKAISVSIDLKLVSDALTLGSSLFWYWIKRRQIHQGLSVLERLVTIPDAELHLPIFTKTLRMIGVLHWNDGNYFSARSNLEKVLELTQADMILQHERAHALAWFGVTQMRLGDYAKARHLEMESLGIFRKLNDQWGTAFASYCLGRILLEIHDLNPAYSATIKACEEFRSIGDPWGLALALSSLGLIYIQNQEYYLAKTTYQESLTVRESLGDQWGVNASLVSLGDLCRLEDDLDHAEKYYQRSLNLLKPFGDSCDLARSLLIYGWLQVQKGCKTEAIKLIEQSLNIYRKFDHRRGIAECLSVYADLAENSSNAVLAAQLLGAADGLLDQCCAQRWPADQKLYVALINNLQSQLGNLLLEKYRQSTIQFSIEEAIQLTLMIKDKFTFKHASLNAF